MVGACRGVHGDLTALLGEAFEAPLALLEGSVRTQLPGALGSPSGDSRPADLPSSESPPEATPPRQQAPICRETAPRPPAASPSIAPCSVRVDAQTTRHGARGRQSRPGLPLPLGVRRLGAFADFLSLHHRQRPGLRPGDAASIMQRDGTGSSP